MSSTKTDKSKGNGNGSPATALAPLSSQVIDLTASPGGSTVDDTPIHSIEYSADNAIQRAPVTRRTQDRAVGRELARQLRAHCDSQLLSQWIRDGVIATGEIPDGNAIPLKLRAIVALRYDGTLPRPGEGKESK